MDPRELVDSSSPTTDAEVIEAHPVGRAGERGGMSSISRNRSPIEGTSSGLRMEGTIKEIRTARSDALSGSPSHDAREASVVDVHCPIGDSGRAMVVL